MRLIYIILLLATFGLLTSCSKDNSEKDTIVVGTSADNPVFEFLNDGKVVGIDIDIINNVGEKLGKKIVIKNLDFTGLFPALNAGNVDIVIAAISSTEERNKFFDFSDTYASTGMGILSRKDIKSLEDLKGKVIGVQLGSTWEITGREILDILPGAKLRSLSNNLILVEELKSGAIDAVVFENVQIAKFMEVNPQLTSFQLPTYSSDFAIVARKGDDIVCKLNGALSEMKKEGVIDNIMKKWID
jgi:polar amino acid transport system substrate-binding protein